MAYITELGTFCSEHPNWEMLLKEKPYCLKIKRDSDYILFTYNQIESDFSLSLVCEARGIIFKEGEWETPVCRGFDKFFNYGETNAASIYWPSAQVMEKIDGSLIKLWYDDNLWRVSTNGTIDAFKAPLSGDLNRSYGSYFIEALAQYYDLEELYSTLDPSVTYLFELVGPLNRMTIPYSTVNAYFLGARNNLTGYEYHEPAPVAQHFNKLPKPQLYSLHTLAECLKVVQDFDWTQEGFVVVDAFGRRIKIKSEEYIKAHYSRFNNTITNEHLIDIIRNNEIEEFLVYASDHRERLNKLIDLIEQFKATLNDWAQLYSRIVPFLERKDYAKFVKMSPSLFQDYLFKLYAQPVSYTVDKWLDRKSASQINELLNSFENNFFTIK